MGNDLFLNAESKKENMSNSKQVLVIVSKPKTIKTSLTTKKKQKIYMMILEIDLLELLSIH